MKKLLVLVALFTTLIATNAQAQQQGGGDPAQMMARMKERIKPGLIEKAKISDAEADKVIEINFASMQQLRGLRELGEAERTKKMEEVQAENTKKFKAIPLTDEQVKAVNDYFAKGEKTGCKAVAATGMGPLTKVAMASKNIFT